MHNISSEVVSWEQRWQILEVEFNDVENGPVMFKVFAELLEKVKSPEIALKLLGLHEHPSLARPGIKVRLGRLICNADSWTLYGWMPPKIKICKVLMEAEETIQAPSNAAGTAYSMLVDHLREKIIKVEEEAMKAAGFDTEVASVQSFTYFSMPIAAAALRTMEHTLPGVSREHWLNRLEQLAGVDPDML